ncbi:MAG TPA: LysE family translocator [bacterium]|nr:LysE family translocator [bacterium]
MPGYPAIGLFLLAALVLLLIPGPAVLNIVACSATHGRRAGLVCVLGTHAATLIHVTAAAAGLSALLVSSALALSTLKYVGAAYLIYLGAQALLTKDGDEQAPMPAPKRSGELFAQGFWVNLLNPKTALFFFAFLPQFLDPARGSPAIQIFIFGALFVTLGSCTDGAYALLAGSVGHWIRGDGRFRRVRRVVTGGIYIGLGLTAAFASPEKK